MVQLKRKPYHIFSPKLIAKRPTIKVPIAQETKKKKWASCTDNPNFQSNKGEVTRHTRHVKRKIKIIKITTDITIVFFEIDWANRSPLF
jgi:hypothetical protein